MYNIFMPTHKKEEDLQRCKFHGIMYDKNKTPICIRCFIKNTITEKEIQYKSSQAFLLVMNENE
jgi:hypothetical protein